MKKKKPVVYYRPPVPHITPPTSQGTVSYQKPLADMTPEEGLAYLTSLRERLLQKQRREQDYLDRRAARGTHTPTDDAYEADQILENEIVALLDDLINGIHA